MRQVLPRPRRADGLRHAPPFGQPCMARRPRPARADGGPPVTACCIGRRALFGDACRMSVRAGCGCGPSSHSHSPPTRPPAPIGHGEFCAAAWPSSNAADFVRPQDVQDVQDERRCCCHGCTASRDNLSRRLPPEDPRSAPQPKRAGSSRGRAGPWQCGALAVIRPLPIVSGCSCCPLSRDAPVAHCLAMLLLPIVS